MFRQYYASLIVLAALLCFLAPDTASAVTARNEGIAVVVNQDAITTSDLQARMKLIIVSSGMPNTDEIRARMEPQIMNVLIEEQLKLQEAERLEITVSDEEIDEGFSMIAKQNNFTAAQFADILRREGIPPSTLEDQIRSQIAWSRVVQRKLSPQVTVNETDILAMRERMLANAGKTEYLISEIFLPVENPRDESDVRQVAERLTRQLIEGKAPFGRVAAQFSQSAGAARGGDLGWIQEGQLAEELDRQLAKMGEGDLSQPVRTLSGYHILLLRSKRKISAENIPDNNVIGTQIGTEQLDRLQRRYLLDLKAASFIEHRV